MQRQISVIIPVYNVEQYLEKSLNSVINQTYRNLEIICVDDGSTDKSGTIIDEYASKDSRIKVIHKENKGVASARNCALEIATGEYITFLDPDDWVEPEMYKVMIEKMEKYKAKVSVCGIYKNWPDKEIEMKNEVDIPEDSIISRDNFLKYCFKRYEYMGFCGYLWNKIFTREILIDPCSHEKMIFDESFQVASDLMFFAPIAVNVESSVYINKPLYHYFQRTDSLIHKGDLKKRIGSLLMYDKVIEIYKQCGIREEIIDYIKRFYTYHASLLTEVAIRNNDDVNVEIFRKEIGKYLDSYYKTSGTHEEWNTRMEQMYVNPYAIVRG